MEQGKCSTTARYNATVRMLALSFALAAGLGLAGCRPALKGKARFAQPRPGVARLLFTRVGPEHFKWSLIGERSWTGAKADGAALSLNGVYPLNSPERQGGTNVWEFDLETKAAGGKTAWKTRVHGSNGVTAESAGEATGDVKLQLDADAELALPATQSLARIGETELTLSLPR